MRKEFERNLVHLLLGTLLALIVYFLEKDIALIFFGIMLIIGTILSEMIIRGKKIFFLNKFINEFERDIVRPGLGMLTFFIGVFISLVFFPSKAVFIGVLALAFNDSISTVVGIAFGKHKIWGKKTLEGSIGGFFGTMIIAVMFLPIETAIVISLATTLIELFAVLDDNVMIPPIVSLLITIIP